MELFANKIESVTVSRFSTLETDSLRTPYMMTCLKNEILLADINQATFISAFNKHSGKWLRYDLLRGNGPGEYLHLANMRTVNDKLFLWDAGQSALSLLSIKHNSSCIQKRIPISSDSCLISAFQVTPVDEEHFIASGIIKGHRLAIIDTLGHTCTVFGNYPFTNEHAAGNDMELALANQGEATYQQKRHRFAISNLTGESISFYDLSDLRHPKMCKEYNYDTPQYKKTGDGSIAHPRDSKMGFIALTSSSDYCIGLFRGTASRSAQDYGGNKLLFFDWDGNPIKAYLLNEYYTYLTVDEETKRIFLLGTDTETLNYKIDILPIPSDVSSEGFEH